MNTKSKQTSVTTRHARIRAKVSGTAERPRLSVHKSNTSVYGQVIDDTKGVTLAASSAAEAAGKGLVEKSKNAGKEIAKLAIAKGVKKVVFDRGGFIYTGKIKAFADGAREGGLEF
ncbi:MAG: 50S ribosomal protein L18 [Patescibacteria group bacterium]|nr:50S ribosomal protein L18 [Patescibacteria group bacterium]MDE1945835.1 50S ribosomal protein L18 [Patescibacteria group bacterium]